MIVQLGEIKAAEESLHKLVQQDLPIKLAWKLGKVVKVLGDEIADIEKQRVALVEKFGDKDEKTGNTQVLPEKMELFIKDWQGLMEEKIDLNIELIDLTLFDSTDIKLNVIDIQRLMPFCVKDEEAPALPVNPSKENKIVELPTRNEEPPA